MTVDCWKGFTRPHLESTFGVEFTDRGVEVPYRRIDGTEYRRKLFDENTGRALRWLGDPRPQIVYGAETLRFESPAAVLTEGESCCWALRALMPRTPILGLPGASSWRSEWSACLRRFEPLYLSFDGDDAGRKLLDQVWPDLPHARRVKLPEGRDSRDVIQNRSVVPFRALIADADYYRAVTDFILQYDTGREAAGVAA